MILYFMFGLMGGATTPFPGQPDISLEKFGDTKKPKVVFFAPHENENVAEDYIIRKIEGKRAEFFVLRQRGDRHLTLIFAEGTLEVDPNRIFTPAGSLSSLLRINPQLEQNGKLLAEAVKRCEQLRQFLFKEMGLNRGKAVIVAVHNNTDGYDNDGKGGVGTVSIERYQKRLDAGAKYIKKIHNAGVDEDDLIFLTHRRDFNYFRRLGYNLVLQHGQVAKIEDEDDGSLSVWAEKKGRRYLNLEAQRDPDHLSAQKRMVDDVITRFLD